MLHFPHEIERSIDTNQFTDILSGNSMSFVKLNSCLFKTSQAMLTTHELANISRNQMFILYMQIVIKEVIARNTFFQITASFSSNSSPNICVVNYKNNAVVAERFDFLHYLTLARRI